MPDAKTGGRPADIGAVVVAGAEAGIDPDGEFPAGKQSAEGVDLGDGARIEENTLLNQVSEVGREFLGRKLDMVWWDTDAEGALDLVAAAGVNVQARIGEDLEDRARRAGFHGVAGGEAESVRKVKNELRLALERLLVIHENRGAELALNRPRDFSGEEWDFHIQSCSSHTTSHAEIACGSTGVNES